MEELPSKGFRSELVMQLRMDNVWFCKVLLLFEIESKSDIGLERHACAFISVMEEYN